MDGPIVVVRNIVYTDDKILFIKRKKDNKWELPGGKVEQELIIVAAIREQKEELGMSLSTQSQHIGYIEGVWRNRHVITFINAWKYEKCFGEPKIMELDKHLAFDWKDRQVALTYPTYFVDSTIQCLKHFKEIKNENE